MIRINLLPFRAARKKEDVRRQVSIFLLSLLLVLATLFMVFWWQNSQINNLQEDIKTTETKLKEYEKINKEIDEIKKKLENLEKKKQIMVRLQAERHEPTKLMAAIADIVSNEPVRKRMWLTRMESRADKVNIAGIALDNKTVADFMVRLEKCGLFQSVNLKNVKKTQVQKSDLKSFSIECKKKPLIKPATNKTGSTKVKK